MSDISALIKKDFLTIWRNKMFLISLIILPILIMSIFILMEGMLDLGIISGDLIDAYFRFTSTLQYPYSLKYYDYKLPDNLS